MLSGKEVGVFSGVCALVFAAGVGAQSVRGLIHERDMYKAIAQQPHMPSATPPLPSTQPTAPAAAPSSSSSPSPTPRVLQVVARSAPSSSAPTPSPSSPSPSPKPRPPTRCPTAAVVTVRLPVRALPCNTVVIGGTR